MEIYNSKRAGVYMNGEYAGYVTDITVRIATEIREHEVIGDDKKVFGTGAHTATFSFTSLYIDSDRMAFMADQYSTYNTATDLIEPAALNNMQMEYAIWQSAVGAGPTVNQLQDDSADADNYQAAQSFIAPGTSLKSGYVSLNRVGAPSAATLNWKIVNDNAGAPGGTSYITGSIAGGSLPGSSTATWVSLGTPTNTTPLVPGTKYWLVLYFGAVNNGTGANYYGWCHSNTNSYYPQVYPQSKSADQTTDQEKTRFSTSTNNGGAWTPSGTYLDQTFQLIFNSETNWNLAIRLVDAAGNTDAWLVLDGCVFNPEDKDLPANDSLRHSYTGVANVGKFQLTYTPLP